LGLPRIYKNGIFSVPYGAVRIDRESQNNMTTPLESNGTSEKSPANSKSSGWLRIGFLAAASAAAGAVAFAWWYRKAVENLQKAEDFPKDPEFGISEGELEEEI